MAKSKRKRRKQPQPTFYEAIPASAPPPSLPLAPDQLQLTFQTLAEFYRTFVEYLTPLRKRALTMFTEAGLATSDTIIRSGRQSLLAARFATDATITYGPSIAADIFGYARRLRLRLFGRQARKLYLMGAGFAAVAGIALGVTTASSTLKSYASDISTPAAILAKKKIGVTITDRNSQVLYQGYGASPSTQITLSDMPKGLKDATLAAEDPSFYDHQGFSLRGTIRAAVTDITHQSKAEGGSTLTQQLVKNALLTSDKKFQRKFQEILLAMDLERRYSKDQILQMYLNQTYYGQGASGVENASRTYFHKSTKELTLGESALLAGLPLGPSRFDPNVNLSDATGRRDWVLGRMSDLGLITPAAAKAAKAQPIWLEDTTNPPANGMEIFAKSVTIRAPHFVFYVLDQLRQQGYSEDMIENGGIRVQTTLDLSKQDLAQNTVTNRIGDLSEHHVTNGGLVSLDPKTGDILAMVGSTDYNAPGFGNVNVTLSELQPGSSFKPIAYATAFKKGWTGATIIQDTPSSFPSGDGTQYVPQNYDLKFHGNVTVRRALDNSLNIPAVKTLQFAGIHDTIQTAHDLGITSLTDESRFGLALVLGGGEVSPLDMATAYATFDNAGTRIEPRSILKVTDRYGKNVTKPSATKPSAVLDPRIAYMITNILSDDSSRQPEFPANGPLHLADRPAAAKTGTTNDFRDNWTVGYTPQLVTAVWVGNNDHTAMYNVDGITGAAPIWHDYMEGASAGMPVQTFTAPAGITTAKVCSLDGGLANPWDIGYDEVFMTSAMPTKHCATQFTKPATSTDPNAPVMFTPITFPDIKQFQQFQRNLNPFN